MTTQTLSERIKRAREHYWEYIPGSWPDEVKKLEEIHEAAKDLAACAHRSLEPDGLYHLDAEASSLFDRLVSRVRDEDYGAYRKEDEKK